MFLEDVFGIWLCFIRLVEFFELFYFVRLEYLFRFFKD